MQMYNFKPNFEVIESFDGKASIIDLEKEVGVYSATPEFVMEHCGDIAKTILSKIPDWYYNEAANLGLFPNCDVRVHRLYPGDFPAYPGWHCDGEYRETYFDQPDMFKIQVHKHLIATVSSHESGVSNFQFLDEELKIETDQKFDYEHTLWGFVDKELDKKRSKRLYDSKDGEITLFDSWSLHRTMPAKIRGWRLFFRMSMWHKPNLDNGGKITKQEQVYKIYEGTGW